MNPANFSRCGHRRIKDDRLIITMPHHGALIMHKTERKDIFHEYMRFIKIAEKLDSQITTHNDAEVVLRDKRYNNYIPQNTQFDRHAHNVTQTPGDSIHERGVYQRFNSPVISRSLTSSISDTEELKDKKLCGLESTEEDTDDCWAIIFCWIDLSMSSCSRTTRSSLLSDWRSELRDVITRCTQQNSLCISITHVPPNSERE